jgi:hypothetical protein
MIKGNNYKERRSYQLNEWVKGNAIHNTVDDECCPDFGCCNPSNLQPKEIRETFAEVSKKADSEEYNPKHHPFDDAKMGMLMSFLGSAMAGYTKKKIHIVNEVNAELN